MKSLSPILLFALLISPQAQAHEPGVGEKIEGGLIAAGSFIGLIPAAVWGMAVGPLGTLFLCPGDPVRCSKVTDFAKAPFYLTMAGADEAAKRMGTLPHSHEKKSNRTQGE